MRSFLATFTFVVLCAAALSAQTNPVPFVNQPLVPATVTPGSASFTLTVNGTGFASGSVVDWNGSPRATTFVSSSQLTATILASDVATASTGTVTVTSPGPGGGDSNSQFLGVTNPFRQITFATSSFGSFEFSYWMISADLNSDGKADLVSSNENGVVAVFLGNGNGTFQPEHDYVVGSTRDTLASVAAGDLNGDGSPDLIVCCVSGQIGVLLGNGDGSFGSASFYAANGGVNSLVTGDFNGDGFLDVAGVNVESNTVAVLLGNGDGTFKSPTLSPSSFEPFYLVAGDFNRDGKLDLVTTSPNEQIISVMLGNGDGTFGSPVTYSAGFNPYTLVAADFNGDGYLDIAVTNDNDAANNSVSIFLGNGDGTLKNPVPFTVGVSPSRIATADLDGDGKLDLMVMNDDCCPNYSLSILFGNGDGSFQPEIVFPVSAGGNIVPADFNGDGRADLALGGSASVYLLTQIPSVNLAPTTLSFVNQEVGSVSAAQTVILTNASNSPLTVTSISIGGANASSFGQTNYCPGTINPGANCSINVTFAPSVVGSDSAMLTVQDSGGPNTQTVALTGNSIGPVVKLSSLTLNFGNQVVGTVSAGQTVTLKNNGTVALAVASIAANGNFSQTNTCRSSVAVGASCAITVTFLPTVPGERTGAITITDNAGPPVQTIHLFGTGTDVSFSTQSLTFAPQKVGTTSPPESIRLTNVGNTTLSFSGFSITGLNAGDFAQSNNCGSTLDRGHSCTISVTFSPSAKGTRNATLAVADNGGGSPQAVTLVGTGK